MSKARKPKKPSRKKPSKRNRRREVSNQSAVSIREAIDSALELQRNGNLNQAELQYRQILANDPNNPDVWHLLGMTLFSSNQLAKAIECLQHSLSIRPNQPELLGNLGVVYRQAGKLSEAQQVLENAIRLDPQSANTHNTLGTVYLELGNFEAAASEFNDALVLNPKLDQAAMNLANLWQKQGRFLDAETIYRTLLDRCPNDFMLLSNYVESLRNQAKWNEAIQVAQKALQLNPDHIETQLNLGRSLAALGKITEALTLFNGLIQQHPNLAKPYHYLGKLLFDQRDMKNATAILEHAVQLDPNDAYAISSLGFTYLESGQNEKAETCLRKVIEIDPSMSQAHGSLLFLMSGNTEIDQDRLFQEHKRWGEHHSGSIVPLTSRNKSFPPLVRNKDRRLKIGYVSPDLRRHAVASFFRPVLEAHDHQQFETYCYAEVAKPDDMTQQLQQLASHWSFTNGLSDQQVAEKIQSDNIDILVDLAGHTSRNRLLAFAYRPAPVQVTWIGYPNTTGLTSIDYRLTCEIQNPLSEPSYHTEQLFRMPRGSFCFAQPQNAPKVSELPLKENGFVTFGTLHRPNKISNFTRDLWADVLAACPNSRLTIFNTRFTDESAEELIHALAERGIDRKRIDLHNQVKEGQSYLEIYHQVDIALDVSPWAGGTTTLEALWMGVPVIAYYGDRRSSRSTAAIMKNIGHQELIANSTQQYVQHAVHLTNDVQRLSELRMNLRQHAQETIFDSQHFTRTLEDAYRTMWHQWCDSNEA